MLHSGLILYPAKQELTGWKWIPWFHSKGCGILEQYGQGFFFPFFVGGLVQEKSKNVGNKFRLLGREAHMQYTRACVPLLLHMETVAPKRNKNSRNEDEPNRPVYAPRSARRAAGTKPSRIPICVSSFRRQRGRRTATELLSTAAHTGPCSGRGTSATGMWSPVICSRQGDRGRSLRPEHRNTCSHWQAGPGCCQHFHLVSPSTSLCPWHQCGQ